MVHGINVGGVCRPYVILQVNGSDVNTSLAYGTCLLQLESGVHVLLLEAIGFADPDVRAGPDERPRRGSSHLATGAGVDPALPLDGT